MQISIDLANKLAEGCRARWLVCSSEKVLEMVDCFEQCYFRTVTCVVRAVFATVKSTRAIWACVYERGHHPTCAWASHTPLIRHKCQLSDTFEYPWVCFAFGRSQKFPISWIGNVLK